MLCLIKDITEILSSLSLQTPPQKRLYNDKENPQKGGSDHGEILIELNMVVVYGV